MTRKILVYGATGGIGSALARRLAERGDALHLVGRDAARLEALAAELGAGSTVGDVTDPDLFARVADDAGAPVDGLAYAVGTLKLGGVSRLDPDDALHDFRVNATGAALAVKAALPALKTAEGPASVVLFSSVAVARGFPMHASIGMAKGAVEGLTRSLAAELAPRVRVNAVAPSLTRTPLAEGLLRNEKMVEALSAQHPLGRLGEPDDAARAAAYLLSTESGWITGQVLGVDGGRAGIGAR